MFFLNTFNSILIVACLILYSYSNPFFSTLSFLTFFFPIFAFLNLIFLIYWVLKLDLKLVLPLILVFLINNNFSSFYNINEPKLDKRGLHLMSYNVRLFNHYKWIENENIPLEIQKFITIQKPSFEQKRC